MALVSLVSVDGLPTRYWKMRAVEVNRSVRLTLWTVVDIVLRTTSLKLSSCVQEEKRSPVLRRKLTLMLLFGA
jgi:hypothetical protein